MLLTDHFLVNPWHHLPQFGAPDDRSRRPTGGQGVIEGTSFTRPETVSALKAADPAAVQTLCEVLDSGNTEARVQAAWLLGQIGSDTAIPALTRTIEGARWNGEPPVLFRRVTEALLRLGPTGIQAFDHASQSFAPEELTRLLLIRQASAQPAGTTAPPFLSSRIITAWIQALAAYLGRLQQLDRVRKADQLSLDRIVLEAYGLSFEEERDTVSGLIEALTRQTARCE